MKLTFNGAAGIVTGSSYLLECGNEKILVDCGMFQGTKDITRLNFNAFQYDPKSVTHMLLTHAHIDHSGLIPKLVKDGFNGDIICTQPTADLAKIMLADTAEVNMQDTEDENKRRRAMGLAPRDPLYVQEDVDNTLGLLHPVEYDTPFALSEGISVELRNAGHILGSSSMKVSAKDSGKDITIVFSGDLGQGGTPIVNDPEKLPNTDYVLIESTYGDRPHGDSAMREELLKKVVNETYQAGGKLIIPSFAVERTQELLYYFHRMVRDNMFPQQTIFLDSPLAIEATEVFDKNIKYVRPELKKEFADPFRFGNLKYLKSAEESKSINDYAGPCVIIAGSGMCNAGRIRNHLKNNIMKSENTILFVGYQAEGTLGRIIEEGAKTVKMMGVELEVKARVEKIDSFSSHADASGLQQWLAGAANKPKRVFIVHGEEESSKNLEIKLQGNGYQTHVPSIGESVDIN